MSSRHPSMQRALPVLPALLAGSLGLAANRHGTTAQAQVFTKETKAVLVLRKAPKTTLNAILMTKVIIDPVVINPVVINFGEVGAP